jgi:glutaredoxin
MSNQKTAKLYRMVMDKHVCPYGLKSKYLLKKKGYRVEDHHLSSREETDAFKEKHDVKTTPQTFIDGKRIGGYDDLYKYFKMPTRPDWLKKYQPVLVIFAACLLMGNIFAAPYYAGAALVEQAIKYFVALSMLVLAILKLQDISKFATMFLGYDVLARRFVPYAYIYPFLEAFAAIGMVSQIPVLVTISAVTAIIIGSIGGYSVFKAVYLEKREIKCACAGGSANVPLGFVSLTENAAMFVMGWWMLFLFQ